MASFTFENAITVIGLLGLGGVIATYFKILWERKNTTQLQKQEYMERRYKATMLLMYTSLDFDNELRCLRIQRPDINTYEELRDELKTEWNVMFLYASDEVIKTSYDFISDPSVSSYKNVVLAMRKDLWGGKLNPEISKLEF